MELILLMRPHHWHLIGQNEQTLNASDEGHDGPLDKERESQKLCLSQVKYLRLGFSGWFRECKARVT